MKVNEKIQIQKFFLNIFNTFFVILGVSIFGCAAWILFDTNSFIVVISSENDVKLVAVTLALIGLVVVVVSVLGCAGGQLESKCLLIIYMGFLIIVTLGQIFVTSVLLLRSPKIEEFLVKTVDKEIKQYGSTNETKASWTLLDRIQHSAKCCGRYNLTDWDQNVFIQTLGEDNVYPCSCFNTTCPSHPPGGAQAERFGVGTTDIYTEGCQKRLTSWLEENIAVIIGMDVGLIVVQVIQFAFAVCIYQNIGRKMRRKNPKNLMNSMEVDPQTDYSQHPQYPQQAYQQQQQFQQQDYQQQHYQQQDYQQNNQHVNDDLQYHQPDSSQQDYTQQYYDPQ